MNIQKVLVLVIGSLTLGGCATEVESPEQPAIEGEEEAAASTITQPLIASSNLSFTSGYGEGYLDPIPDTRFGVVDGMLGWIETDTYTPFPGYTVREHAFRTRSERAGSKNGYAHLKFSGTDPATGTCALRAGSLIVKGQTYVKGSGWAWTSTDAIASATVTARGWVGGSMKYYKYWYPAEDKTSSESRATPFDKSYSLANGPSFYATKGERVELDVQLHLYAYGNSEGTASVSIYQYGFLANVPNNIVWLDCY